jgi:hypothetical protein
MTQGVGLCHRKLVTLSPSSGATVEDMWCDVSSFNNLSNQCHLRPGRLTGFKQQQQVHLQSYTALTTLSCVLRLVPDCQCQ